MEAPATTRVKICCISSVTEAWMAIRHGASALGLVSTMPSGPGVIDEDEIARIARITPPGVASVLLTSLQDADAIVRQQRRVGVNTLQLVDEIPLDSYAHLRSELPGINIMQVIHVTGPESVDQACNVAPHVDAILLDSGNPTLEIKELGGTGRVHDWTFSRRIREEVDVPVYLAGGLNPGNAGEAIRRVGPFGLDLCSGVRTNGALDEEKLGAFFAQVRSNTPAN